MSADAPSTMAWMVMVMGRSVSSPPPDASLYTTKMTASAMITTAAMSTTLNFPAFAAFSFIPSLLIHVPVFTFPGLQSRRCVLSSQWAAHYRNIPRSAL